MGGEDDFRVAVGKEEDLERIPPLELGVGVGGEDDFAVAVGKE